jgi:hypothetical protein
MVTSFRNPIMTTIAVLISIFVLTLFLTGSAAKADTLPTGILVYCNGSVSLEKNIDYIYCFTTNRAIEDNSQFNPVPLGYEILITDISVDPLPDNQFGKRIGPETNIVLSITSDYPDIKGYMPRMNIHNSGSETIFEHFTTPPLVIPAGWIAVVSAGGLPENQGSVFVDLIGTLVKSDTVPVPPIAMPAPSAFPNAPSRPYPRP